MIDASSKQAFKDSLQSMHDSLSEEPAKQKKLEFAIKMMSVSGLGSHDGNTFQKIYGPLDGCTYDEVIREVNKMFGMDIDTEFAESTAPTENLRTQRKDEQPNKQSSAALSEIELLRKSCIAYKTHVGKFPSKLRDLYTKPRQLSVTQWGGPYIAEPVPNDPWGNPYFYSIANADERVTITSCGPDQRLGSQDDVKSLE